MKKYLFIFIVIISMLFGHSVFAQTQVTPTLNTSIVPACANADPATNPDCYTLIEPLPGSDGTPITSIDLATTGGSGGLGGFINFAMEIGIGIAGVLGVIMLVVYGFQYAAEDKNVGNFTMLREKITKVILGLMLLLGITIILRTINPDLLIVEPAIKMAALDLDENGDGFDPFDNSNNNVVTTKPPASGSNTLACPAGFESVGYNEFACKTIAGKIRKMIADARAANVPLGIKDGYRSYDEQVYLRNKNCSCGGNQSCIMTKPVKQCDPDTAFPGKSNHGAGLAFDLSCNGGSLRYGSSCYAWLQANASKSEYASLKHLIASEPWHWSINGH